MPTPARSRPLTQREREALEFILRLSPPPSLKTVIPALRDQIGTIQVVDGWDCCPSVTFAAPNPEDLYYPIVEARHKSGRFDLMLFVSPQVSPERPILRCLEIVHYADDTIDDFPPLSEFDEPFPTTFD